MTFTVGENVGAYRIVEQLGQGGMATVYKAYHASLDRYVAVKVLHAAFKEDATFLARFQREARVVAKLEHPNIVPVYDFADHNGSPYLVMKFIEGETLKATLARGPLPLGEVLTIVEAVGAGLQFAHEQGVLHRDIKPSNIMLASDGGIFLADFGLARIALAGESTLSSDSMLGTPQYISPEQAKGVKDLDAGADIYSLGVVLYELVVGRVPYSADTPFAVIHDHIYAPLPVPRSINPNVPETAERVLFKAMAKERADRYADVTQLVAAFREAVLPIVNSAAPGASVTTALPGPVPIAPAAPTPFSSRSAETAAAPASGAPEPDKVKPHAGYHFQLWHPFAALALMGCLCFGIIAVGNRARAASLAGRPQTAAAPAATARSDAPASDTEALLTAARIAFENGNPDEGRRLLNEAVHSKPDEVAVLMRAGDVALQFGLTTEALAQYYVPALNLEAAHPDDLQDDAVAQAALALYVLAGNPLAQHDLEVFAARLTPREIAQAALVRWMVLNGHADDVRQQADQLRGARPGFYGAILVEGDYFFSQQNLPEAGRAYAQISEQSSGQAPGWALAEARCRIEQLRRDGRAAQLGVTCEPLSSLVTGK